MAEGIQPGVNPEDMEAKEPSSEIQKLSEDPKDIARYIYTGFEIGQGSTELQGLLMHAESLCGATNEISSVNTQDVLDQTQEMLATKYNLPKQHASIQDKIGTFQNEVDKFKNIVEGKQSENDYYTKLGENPQDLEEINKRILLTLTSLDIQYQEEKPRPGRDSQVSSDKYDTREDPHASYINRFIVKGDTRGLHKTHADFLAQQITPVYDKYKNFDRSNMQSFLKLSQEDPTGFNIVSNLSKLERAHKAKHP